MILLFSGIALAVLVTRAERRRHRDAKNLERWTAGRLVPRGYTLAVHNPSDEALTREALRASREAIHQAELARQRRYRKFERGTSI